jgi:hypothetical protein
LQRIEAALVGRQKLERYVRELLSAGVERGLVVALAGTGKSRQQNRARLAEFLQAVVLNLWFSDRLELRAEMSKQDFMQCPLEQAEPFIGLDERQEALGESLILRRAECSQRGERHIDERQLGAGVEAVDEGLQFLC